jgi:hypothetical protein
MMVKDLLPGIFVLSLNEIWMKLKRY